MTSDVPAPTVRLRPPAAPRARAGARAAHRLARLRRQRRRAHRRRLRRVRPRRDPRRPRPRRGDQAQARLRRGAHARGARAVARPHRAAGRPSRRAVAGPPLRAPARDQARAGRRRAAPARPPRGLRAASRSSRAVEQWRYRNKLEYSFGTDDRTGELVCGFHAPGSWEDIVHVEDCLLPSERGNEARRARARRGRASRAWAPTTAARRPACCATSSIREGRRTGELQVRLVVSQDARDRRRLLRRRRSQAESLLVTRIETRRRDDRRRPDRAPHRQRRDDRRGARRPALPALRPRRSSRRTPRWPSGSTRSPREFAGAAGLGARLRPVLRHRHDRPVARRPRRRGLGPRDRRGGDRRRDRATPRPTRSPTPASSPATCGWRCATSSSSAGRPDVIVVDPPRAGLSQKVVRRIIEAAPQAHRLRLLQPDDAGAERRAARRGRLRAAQRAPGRHVPADAAHRVRGAARARGVALRAPWTGTSAVRSCCGSSKTSRGGPALDDDAVVHEHDGVARPRGRSRSRG